MDPEVQTILSRVFEHLDKATDTLTGDNPDAAVTDPAKYAAAHLRVALSYLEMMERD